MSSYTLPGSLTNGKKLIAYLASDGYALDPVLTWALSNRQGLHFSPQACVYTRHSDHCLPPPHPSPHGLCLASLAHAQVKTVRQPEGLQCGTAQFSSWWGWMEAAVHKSTKCKVRWGLGSGQVFQVGVGSGEMRLQRKGSPGYRRWGSSLPPSLPFLHLYLFLMQWPHQPLKPLSLKCNAHPPFVSLILITLSY